MKTYKYIKDNSFIGITLVEEKNDTCGCDHHGNPDTCSGAAKNPWTHTCLCKCHNWFTDGNKLVCTCSMEDGIHEWNCATMKRRI